MQYSTLFVCLCSHDQVMNTWCFRFVWRLRCLREVCELCGGYSPTGLASATQISDYQGVCLLHRTGSPAEYVLLRVCEEWQLLQVSLETFNNSVFTVNIFY